MPSPPSYVATRWDHIASDEGYVYFLISAAEFGRVGWFRSVQRHFAKIKKEAPYIIPSMHEVERLPDAKRPGLGQVLLVTNRIVKVDHKKVVGLAEIRDAQSPSTLFARVRTTRVNLSRSGWSDEGFFANSVVARAEDDTFGQLVFPNMSEPPPSYAHFVDVDIRSSDCDTLDHVTNTAYTRIFAATEQGLPWPATSQLQVRFLKEIKPGTRLRIHFWDVSTRDGSGTVTRLKMACDLQTNELKSTCIQKFAGPKVSPYGKGRSVPTAPLLDVLAHKFYSRSGPTRLTLHVNWEDVSTSSMFCVSVRFVYIPKEKARCGRIYRLTFSSSYLLFLWRLTRP